MSEVFLKPKMFSQPIISAIAGSFAVPADIHQDMTFTCKEPVKVNHSRITGIAKAKRAARKARMANK